jgi:uncharacterized protein
MLLQAITAGVLLGLVSSFHCVGMCGPLALSLPVHHYSYTKKVAAILLYNAGRITTYTLQGFVFGYAGRYIYLAGLQQSISVVSGFIVLFFSVHYFLLKKNSSPKWLQSLHLQLQQAMSFFWGKRSLISFTGLGMVNGLLPCGMVYIAIAGAVSSSSVINSMVFMGAFGTGTLPAMLALALFGLRINLASRNVIKKAMPYLMMAMAVLLILRGLNLGIPFISPVMAQSPGVAVSCH